MPKKIVAAPARIATNASSGWTPVVAGTGSAPAGARSSSGEPPASAGSVPPGGRWAAEGPCVPASEAVEPIHIAAITGR